MKRCCQCKQEKPFPEFAKDSSRPDGLQRRCRPCQKGRSRGHYETNKPVYREAGYRMRNQLRDDVRVIKEASPCVDCEKSYPYYVMQFDHVGTDKVGSIASMISRHKGREAVFAEIAKCELICANCHAIRTHTRRYLEDERPAAQLVSKTGAGS